MMREETQERFNLLLEVLQTAMKSTGVAIGFDLESKKLILFDIETGLSAKIDLEKLNECLEGVL